MATRPIDPAKIAKVLDLLKVRPKLTRDDIAKKAEVSAGSVTNIAKNNGEPTRIIGAPRPPLEPKQPKPKLGDQINVTDTEMKVFLPCSRICTEAQLVEHCQIDLKIWEIKELTFNKWEMGFTTGVGDSKEADQIPLFQVKARCIKKVAVANALAEIAALRKEAFNYSPKKPTWPAPRITPNDVAAELFNTDHHFGALIWGEETGGPDWDTKIANEAWKDSFSTLCSRVDGYKPTLAVLPMGSDQQNSDNTAGLTSNLTPQSMDSRYQKVYGMSKEASKFAIDMALQKYGRVHVPIVPGNHDRLAAFHLGDYLATWYRNCPEVTIDNAPRLRKWWEFGNVMVMFEHGDKGKLKDYGKDMASEKPEMWGRTKWREAHTGDKHTRRVFEDKGYTARGFPSLRPSCAWSIEFHLSGSIQASEALVWSKVEGLIGQATFSILRKSEE